MGAQRYPSSTTPYAATREDARHEAAPPSAWAADDWQLPPLAVTFAQPRRAPVPGEPIREELSQPARPHAHDLPAVRRVRHRLQLRQPRTRSTTRTCRRRSAPGAELRTRVRGEGASGPRGRRLRRRVRGPPDAREGEPPECPAVDAAAHASRRTGWCWRRARSAPRTCCSKNRAAFPGLSRTARHALLRQRGPAGLPAASARTAARASACRASSTAATGPVITSALHIRTRDGGRHRAAATTSRTRATRSSSTGSTRAADQLALLRRVVRLGRRIVQGWLRPEPGHGRERGDRRGDGRLRGLRQLAAAARHGPRHPRWRTCALTEDGLLDVDWTHARLAPGVLRAGAPDDGGDRRRARGQAAAEPAELPEPGHHRAPARRLSHGPRRRARAWWTRTARCSTTPASTWRTAR